MQKIRGFFAKFKKSFSDIKIINTSLYVLIKSVLLGILIAEIWYFLRIIYHNVIKLPIYSNYKLCTLIFLVYAAILFTYLFFMGFFTYVLKVIRSKRIDIILALSFGSLIDIAQGGFFLNFYSRIISLFNTKQLLLIINFPFLLGFIIILKAFFFRKDLESSLIPDIELEERKDDLLNFTDKANKFAECVFNGGSSKSFVFGVDAPWGIGKSSFVNFCQEYWHEHYPDRTVIYKFSPLQYTEDANLFEIFIEGLTHAIQKDSFVPEIRPLISKYSHLLKEANRFSFLGFNIPNFTVNSTVKEVLDDLIIVLKHFNKKVIIIVDDLDRIDFADIKDIVTVIRKSFALPNISYILCYDTENIGTLELKGLDVNKVSEFLEKFVNIKISLYLDRKDLSKFVSDNLDKALSNKLVDPMLVRQAIGGLLDIYKSSEYHKYLPFIGDIRKLKRLINTVVMFELQGTDFKNSDFDKHDLIHLLLLYIHYPNIFRKIYDTETNGGRGFFSVVTKQDDNYPKDSETSDSFSHEYKYTNSTDYNGYLKKFPEDSGQRFLLNQVFNTENRLENPHASQITEEERNSFACFNGGLFSKRNLEAYLNLIANLSKPQSVEQYRFYANFRDQIFKGSITIDEVLAKQEFFIDKGEKTHKELWRIIINNARSLNEQTSRALIIYLVNNIHSYSLIEISEIGIGFRRDLIYLLIRLLNDSGWIDQTGGHSNNTEENIKEISEWIFGEKRHRTNGILEQLSQPTRGILGLYDLMLFRLYCSADRRGDIFDLTRALSTHANQNAPNEGNLNHIATEEMREISQKVFHIFKIQYIDTNRNIFSEIEKIGLDELAGEYITYVKNQIQNGIIHEEDVSKKVEILKNRISTFIVYQIGNNFINQGVGCGFYDPIGNEDGHQIKAIFNDYLFDFCFNPEKDEKNFEYFLNYILINFTYTFISEDVMDYTPQIDQFIEVLDERKLADYWRKYYKAIKELDLHKKEKIIFVDNYKASYKVDLLKVYQSLDNLIKEELNE